jgi:hypothetical protein
MLMKYAGFVFYLLLLVVLLVSSAHASGTIRTFVASTGSDSNPCSRAAPCRTFQAAVNATAQGGEVVALDSAGFGANVTVKSAISIVASPGAYAAVTVSSGDGISISAGSSDKVTLRGLTIISQGTDANGVVFNTGAALHMEDCVIEGFSGLVASAVLQNVGRLFIKDTTMKKNTTAIQLKPSTGTIFTALDNVTMTQNSLGLGLFALKTGQIIDAAIIRSSIADNAGQGIHVEGDEGGTANLDIESCLITNNGAGLAVGSFQGVGAASISNSLMSHNSVFGFFIEGGAILSRGNNTFIGNGPDSGSLTPFGGQ